MTHDSITRTLGRMRTPAFQSGDEIRRNAVLTCCFSFSLSIPMFKMYNIITSGQ